MNDLERRPKNGLLSAAVIAAILMSLVAIAVTLIRTSADSTVPERPVNTLRTVLDRKVIRAAAVPIPPLVNIDPSTKSVTGLAPDILAAIASKAGLTVQYTVADWGNMGSELISGRSDVICSGVFMNLDRAKEFSFTDPFSYWGMVAVVPAGSTSVKTRADLKLPGLRVAALSGEQGHLWAKKNMPDAVITPVLGSDLTKPMTEVITGRADVVFSDLQTARRFVKEQKGARVLFEDDPLDVLGAGFMLRQGDRDFQEFLNIGLQQLNLSGELETLDGKYSGQKSWLSISKPWK